jgi:hypothetical protein
MMGPPSSGHQRTRAADRRHGAAGGMAQMGPGPLLLVHDHAAVCWGLAEGDRASALRELPAMPTRKHLVSSSASTPHPWGRDTSEHHSGSHSAYQGEYRPDDEQPKAQRPHELARAEIIFNAKLMRHGSIGIVRQERCGPASNLSRLEVLLHRAVMSIHRPFIGEGRDPE